MNAELVRPSAILTRVWITWISQISETTCAFSPVEYPRRKEFLYLKIANKQALL